jgi:pathogenesis-related protein 1
MTRTRVLRWLAMALLGAGAALADEVPDTGGGAQVTMAAPAEPQEPVAPVVLPGSEPPEYAGLVAAHNYWRREVGVGDLQWSADAARVAQKWADDLKAENCPMRHNLAPERKKYFGENVYRYWRTSPYPPFYRNSKYVTDAWGAESLWFDGSANSCHAPEGGTCGHYTQVVWAYSKLVGCGHAHCGASEVWVCEYFPRGNYIGVRPFPHSSPAVAAVDPMPSEAELINAIPWEDFTGDPSMAAEIRAETSVRFPVSPKPGPVEPAPEPRPPQSPNAFEVPVPAEPPR